MKIQKLSYSITFTDGGNKVTHETTHSSKAKAIDALPAFLRELLDLNPDCAVMFICGIFTVTQHRIENGQATQKVIARYEGSRVSSMTRA